MKTLQARMDRSFAIQEVKRAKALAKQAGFPRGLTEMEREKVSSCLGLIDLSQNDLADLCNLTPSYLSLILRGKQVRHKTYLNIFRSIDYFDIPYALYNHQPAKEFPRLLAADETEQIREYLSLCHVPMTYLAARARRPYGTIFDVLNGKRACDFSLYQAILKAVQGFCVERDVEFKEADKIVAFPECDPPGSITLESRNYIDRPDLDLAVRKAFDLKTFRATGLAASLTTMQVVGPQKSGRSLAMGKVNEILTTDGCKTSTFRASSFVDKDPTEVFRGWAYEQTGDAIESAVFFDPTVFARKLAKAFVGKGRNALIVDGLDVLPDRHLRKFDKILEALRLDVRAKVELGVVISTSHTDYNDQSRGLVFGGSAFIVRPFSKEQVLELACKFPSLASKGIAKVARDVYETHLGNPLPTQEAFYSLSRN